MLSKVKLLAATLAVTMFAAVPAVAQNTLVLSEDDNSVETNDSAVGGDGGDSGDVDASGGDGGTITQNAVQYDNDQVSANVTNGGTGGAAIDTGAEQTLNADASGGDGGIGVSGDGGDGGDAFLRQFFNSFNEFFSSFFD